MYTRLFMASLLVTATSSAAWACPGAYAGLECDGGATINVCSQSPTEVWGCNLSANGDSGAANITIVSAVTSFDYSAWGEDSAGNSFCCELTSSDVNRVSVSGSLYADTISFTTTISGVTYDLANMGSSTKLIGFVAGHGGDDVINGSNTTADYDDQLHGDDGADTVNGNNGADEITGDLGNDYITGGSGKDVLHGNDGDDTIYGDGGEDNITGDAGNDIIRGGGDNDLVVGGTGLDSIDGDAGNDKLMGNEGVDAICGGNGNDSICGGADDDQLWGGNNTDSATGRAGVDACSAESIQECESTLTTKPTACP